MLSELYMELCQETSLPAGNVQSNLPAAKTSARARDGGQRGQAEIGAPLIEQDASPLLPFIAWATPSSQHCAHLPGVPQGLRDRRARSARTCSEAHALPASPSVQQNLATLNWERNCSWLGPRPGNCSQSSADLLIFIITGSSTAPLK